MPIKNPIRYIGVASTSGVFIFLLLKLKKRDFSKYVDFLAPIYLIGFFIGIFFMSKLSLIFWERLPFLNLVLFPWRFINLLLISGAFLCAYIVSKFRLKLLLATFFIFIAIFPSRHFWKWQGQIPIDDAYYINYHATYHGTTTAEGEYTPRGVTESVKQFNTPAIEVLEGEAQILNGKNTPNNWQFDVEVKQKSKIKLA